MTMRWFLITVLFTLGSTVGCDQNGVIYDDDDNDDDADWNDDDDDDAVDSEDEH